MSYILCGNYPFFYLLIESRITYIISINKSNTELLFTHVFDVESGSLLSKFYLLKSPLFFFILSSWRAFIEFYKDVMDILNLISLFRGKAFLKAEYIVISVSLVLNNILKLGSDS